MTEKIDREQMIALTADIVSAFVSNNPVPPGELSGLIGNVHKSLTGLVSGEPAPSAEPLKPAVPVKKSVQNDYIVCLEDGKKFKSLKRHIGVHFGLSPAEYRQKWNLPSDYPMVAPAYAAARSALAKQIGLGRKPKQEPVKRGRRKAV